MTERPRRNAVTNREVTDTLLANKKHCTPAQVQQDRDIATSAAAAAEVEKTIITAQKKNCIASFEDQLRREDQQREKNMARPDLAAHHVCAISYFNLTYLIQKKIFTTQRRPSMKANEIPVKTLNLKVQSILHCKNQIYGLIF